MLEEIWEWRKILIVVKTYPTPARQGIEVSCTAGITDDGQWIRLFPIPFRFLRSDQKFKKYQWIKAKVKKASDPRVESYNVDIDSIRLLGTPLPLANSWIARKEKVFPLKSTSLCELQRKRNSCGEPTLGFFRPKRITSLEIEETDSDWSESDLSRLTQASFFDGPSLKVLEKIPYRFYYRFECEDADCIGSHKVSCYDWEMSQSYRSWYSLYGPDGWEEKFKQKYSDEMIRENDTHFYMGTIRSRPNVWIIVGLFFPRRASRDQPPLFKI